MQSPNNLQFTLKTEISNGYTDSRIVTNVLNSNIVGTNNTISIFPSLVGLNISVTNSTTVSISEGTVPFILNKEYLNVKVPSLTISSSIIGAGGFDEKMSSNVWYYVYIIYNTANNFINAIASSNQISPTLPTGYTLFKRIGTIRSDLAVNTILNVYQIGSEFDKTYYWSSIPTTTNGVTIINTSTPTTATVNTFDGAPPVASLINGIIKIVSGTNNDVIQMGKSTAYLNPVATTLNGITLNDIITIPTENGQIAYTLLSGTLTLVVQGWVENL